MFDKNTLLCDVHIMILLRSLGVIGVALAFSFYGIPAYAQEETDDQYRIEINSIEIQDEAEKPEPTAIPTPEAGLLIPQTSQSTFEEQGYIILPDDQASSRLRLSLSRSSVSFGEVASNQEAKESVRISLMSEVQTPYRLYTHLDSHLKTTRNSYIIRTKCDSPEAPCTRSQAQPWTSSRAYGFGYTVTGPSVLSDFIDDTYFRPFAHFDAQERPHLMADGTSEIVPDTTTMNIKLQFPETQPEGSYTSELHVIALPY
jgi:hypothetical protein